MLITRGRLWDWRRIAAVWNMNLGRYEHLLERTRREIHESLPSGFQLPPDNIAAIRELTRKIAVDPSDPILYACRGRFHAQQGDYAEAIRDFCQALALGGKNHETCNSQSICYCLGSCYETLGDAKQAARRFRQAIELAPDRAEPYIDLGCLVWPTRPDAAADLFRKAIECDPLCAKAYNNLGEFLASSHPAEAMWHLTRALEIEPDFAEAHYNLAIILAGSGRVDEAISHYQKTLKIHPNNAAAHNNLGVALAGEGRLDEAIAHYQKALEINPDLAQARVGLGMAIDQRTGVLKALAEQRESLHSNPNNLVLLNDTAWTLATNPNVSVRNGAEAVDLAQRAAQLTGGRDPAILGTLAAAYAEAGRFADAVQTARNAQELAVQQHKQSLAESIKAKLPLYETKKPYRKLSQPLPRSAR